MEFNGLIINEMVDMLINLNFEKHLLDLYVVSIYYIEFQNKRNEK